MGFQCFKKTTSLPGTLNNHFFMDGNGETPIFHVMILNHPIETSMFKWMFRVPGKTLKKKQNKLNSIITQVQATPHPLYICSLNNRGSLYSKPKPCTQIYKNNTLASTLTFSPFQTKVETQIEWCSSWIFFRNCKNIAQVGRKKSNTEKHSQGPKRLVQQLPALIGYSSSSWSSRKRQAARAPALPILARHATAACRRRPAWGVLTRYLHARVPGTPNKP